MSENTQQIQLNQQAVNSLSDFNTLIQFANLLCKSEALPATYKNSANVLVALQTGKEMGLEPMQSLRMLYIVNGNIKPWGTAYPYFLKKAGYKIAISKHDEEICEVTVTNDTESYSYTADRKDVKKDSKAMGFAPKEKLYFHACARIINYYLPEIMSGMNFDNQTDDFTPIATEEVQDKKTEILDKLKLEPEVVTEPKVEVETKSEAIKFVEEAQKAFEQPETSDGSLIEDKMPATNV